MYYRKNLLSRGLVWLARFRYRKGYGVQSPSVYHFIRHVIFETAPYYEYERLKQVYLTVKSFQKRILPRNGYELIFRIAQETKATEIIEIGTLTGLGTLYASAARKTASCYILISHPISDRRILRLLARNPVPLIQESGNIDFFLQERDRKRGARSATLFLLDCDLFPELECAHLMETLLALVKPADCILLSGIHRSKELVRQWKKYTTHPAISLSFDLYEAGILFSKPYFPQKCYLINY